MKIVSEETLKKLQEWKYYAGHNRGTNNLAVCVLNYPGDGAMSVATGTSLKGMEAAVKNAYRNLKRYRDRMLTAE